MLPLTVSLLGTIDYQEALHLQERLLKLRQQGTINDVLLLLEHPPTLTLGLKADGSNIIAPQEALKARGVQVFKVNRGGDVTYHGPGQIVGYPILDLKGFGRDVPGYFRRIEETFIQLMQKEYGIQAGRNAKYPGVWVGDDKITAIGCSLKRWVTMHGFAFNVNTDLDHFQWIHPCGISDKGVTSLHKIVGCPQNLAVVHEQVIKYFCAAFDVEPQIIDTETLFQMAG